MAIQTVKSTKLTANDGVWNELLQRLEAFVSGSNGGPASHFSVAYSSSPSANEQGLCLTPDASGENWQLNLYYDDATNNYVYATVDPGSGFSSNADTLSPSSAQSSQGRTVPMSETGSNRPYTPWSSDFWVSEFDDCLLVFFANDAQTKVSYVFMLGKPLLPRFSNDGSARNFTGHAIFAGKPEFRQGFSNPDEIFNKTDGYNSYVKGNQVRVAKEEWIGRDSNPIFSTIKYNEITKSSYGSGSNSWETPTLLSLQPLNYNFYLGQTKYYGHIATTQYPFHRATDLQASIDWVYLGESDSQSAQVVIPWESGVSVT